MRCEEVQLTTLTPFEREAWAKATHFEPWRSGMGNVPMLVKGAIESERALPAIFKHRLYRCGLCLQGQALPIPLLEQEKELAWWHWPHSGLTLFAAGWPYQRAWDDPQLQEALYLLLGNPVTIQLTIYPSTSATSLVPQVLQQAFLAGHPLTAQEFARVYSAGTM